MREAPTTTTTPPARNGSRFGVADLLLLAVPFLALFPLRNNDLWWHLAAGRWMTEHRAFPSGDPFSFTGFMGNWVDNEWLSQLVFHGAWMLGDDLGLVALRAALYAALFVQIRSLLALRRRPSATLWAFVIGIALSYGWWELRPSVFSLVGCLALLQILERIRRRGRGFAALPALFLVWASLHPGFLFGMCVLAGTTAAAFVERRLKGWRRWSRDAELPRRLAVWTAASALATLANPYGWQVYRQQFAIAGNTAYRALLDEWAPPSTAFLALVLATVGGFLLARHRRVPLPTLVPILGAAALSTTGVRFVEYFALVAVPLLLTAIGSLKRRGTLAVVAALVVSSLAVGLRSPLAVATGEGSPDPAERRVEERIERNVVLLSLAAAAGLGAVLFGRRRLPTPPRAGRRTRGVLLVAAVAAAGAVAWAGSRWGAWPPDGVEPDRYPTACLDALPAQARVFGRLSWGGWLVWKKDAKTFVDGRCWGQPIFFEYSRARAPGGEAVLDRHRVEWVVLPPDDPLARRLSAAPGWGALCDDGTSVVYRRLPSYE